MEEAVVEERLAAAAAIPPSQRSPEVAAFIECCQLQRELAKEQRKGFNPTRQQDTLAALKLTKSNVSSPAAPLWYQPSVYEAALERVLSAAGILGKQPAGDSGGRIMALINSAFSARTLLLVAAAAPLFGKGGANITRLLPVYNRIVEGMQRPAKSAKLQQELAQLQADLPHSLLSYHELLAYFVKLASNEAAELMATGDGSMAADIDAAYRAHTELVPRLVPGVLHRQFFSMMAAGVHSVMARFSADDCRQTIRSLSELLQQAQQQGSDFTVALCGYQLASLCADYGAMAHKKPQHAAQTQGSSEGLPSPDGVLPPSVFLGWLRQARQAHARCRGTLPKQWTVGFERRQQAPLAWKPWLQRLQREGDRWQPPSGQQINQVDAATLAGLAKMLADPSAKNRCTSCGSPSPHLRRCGACKQAWYCSREC